MAKPIAKSQVQPIREPCPRTHKVGWRRLSFPGFRRRWHRGRATQPLPLIPGALPLSAVPAGQVVRVCAVQGGHMFLSRLACLGFTPGVCLRVVQNYGSGPLIVALRDTRVALGRSEALRIVVEPRTEPDDGAG